jgi:hypothetical protein
VIATRTEVDAMIENQQMQQISELMLACASPNVFCLLVRPVSCDDAPSCEVAGSL